MRTQSRQLSPRDRSFQRYKDRHAKSRFRVPLSALASPRAWCAPCLEHGELSVCCPDRDRAVDLFWSEKAWLLLDHLQIFAALWVTGCVAATKRFPQSWCQGSSPILYANLDTWAWHDYARKALNVSVAVADDAPGWGEVGGGWYERHASLLILAPPAVFVLLACELYLVREPLLLLLGGGAGRGAARFVPAIERGVVRGLLVVMMPWAVLASRRVLCVEMQAISQWQYALRCGARELADDPSRWVCRRRLGCDDASRDLLSPASLRGLAYCAAIAVLALGLPVMLVLLNARARIYSSERKHEWWLRAVETEFVVGLSSLWALHHYSLSSSFPLAWQHATAATTAIKVVIAALLAATYQTSVAGVPGDRVRDVALLAIMMGWLLLLCLSRTRSCRVWSTHAMAVVCVAAHVCTLVPRVLVTLGFHSQLLYLLAILIPAHHLLALAMLVAIVAHSLWRRERWPVSWHTVRAHDAHLLQQLVALQPPPAPPAHAPRAPPARASASALRDFFQLDRVARSGVLGQGEAAAAARARLSLSLASVAPLAADAVQVAVGGEAGGEHEVVVVVEEEEEEELALVHKRLEVMRGMLLEERLRTREFVRTHHLRLAVHALADCANRMHRARHPLFFATEDLLDDLLSFYNASLPHSLSYYQPLRALLPAFRRHLDRRDRRLFLAGPTRKRILLKLYACRVFIRLRLRCAHQAAARLDHAPDAPPLLPALDAGAADAGGARAPGGLVRGLCPICGRYVALLLRRVLALALSQHDRQALSYSGRCRRRRSATHRRIYTYT